MKKNLLFVGLFLLVFLFAVNLLFFMNNEPTMEKKISNDVFETKPKMITKDSNSMSLEKEAYEMGELIQGNFHFLDGLYVAPYVRISKHENNEWNPIGDFGFSGNQIVCCGLIPPCEKMQSPLNIFWNQKFVPQENLPVIPPNNASQYEKQVDRGMYKFTLIYGDGISCIEDIGIEFEIN